jgi:hypothetical protein
MSINNLEEDTSNNAHEINELISDLNSPYLDEKLDFNSLYRHKDIIFSNSSINLKHLLKRLLNAKFNQTNEEIEIQGRLLEIALNKGATINNSEADFMKYILDPKDVTNTWKFFEDRSFEINYNSLLNHHSILLNHPTNPMSAMVFLKSTLAYQVEEYNERMFETKPIIEKIESQKKLIELTLNKGEKFSEHDTISISLNNLYYHRELFFKHLDEQIYLRAVKIVSLKSYGNDETELSKKAKIIELIESKLGLSTRHKG